MSYQVEMTTIQCYKCGVPFAVPTEWNEYRLRDCRRFWCPNGHGQAYIKKNPPSVEERRELVHAMHRAEQAEARAEAAEARAEAGASSGASQDDLDDKDDTEQRVKPIVCAKCGKTYGPTSWNWFRKHLSDAHDVPLAHVGDIEQYIKA